MNNNKVLQFFRRLAKPNSRLGLLGSAKKANEPADAHAVFVGGKRLLNGMTVAPDKVRDWLSEGLIERCDDGYRITQAGLSWLRRRLSSTDDYQSQHQTRAPRVIDFEGVRRTAIVNEAESPLRWLASRKDRSGAPMLAAFQVEAGERLRTDYQFAGLTARVTASWSPIAQSGASCGAPSDAAAMQEHILAARQRVVRALAAVGPELSGILVDVCCHLKGLEEAEKTEGWPQRSGKVVLQMALTRLARHYGLVSDDQLNEKVRRRLQHWGAGDYRPKIGGSGTGSL